jgi:inner membrane protein
VPTPFGHLAVPLLGRALAGGERVPRALLAAGCLAAVVPDADIVAFSLGIEYSHPFGHRGFSHSLLFAFLVAAAATLALGRAPGLRTGSVFLFVFLCGASHGVLDAFTNGGLGVAFFAPFSNERYFFPVQPIQVASLHPARIFSAHGVRVLETELLWIWLPTAALAAAAVARRSRRAR